MTNAHTRAVSTEKEFTKLKNADKLFWYLLTVARYEHFPEKTLYVFKDEISIPDITGKSKLNLFTRPTYYSKLKELQGLKANGEPKPGATVFIKEGTFKGKECFFIKNDFAQFALIDTETITMLLKHAREHVLKTYAYLKFLDGADNEGISPSTLIKNGLGLTLINKDAIDKVYETLVFLKRLGLVEYEVIEQSSGKHLPVAGEQIIKHGDEEYIKRQAHFIKIVDVYNWADGQVVR